MEVIYLNRDLMSIKDSKQTPDIDWKTVGRRIRELRGFDQKQSEFAHEIGVAQSYISAIERGQKEPGAAVLFRIARLHGKTIEWLLTGNDPWTRLPNGREKEDMTSKNP